MRSSGSRRAASSASASTIRSASRISCRWTGATFSASLHAKGGPGGRPGCWQPITRDLWPMPYLVMDTGASLAPYNHFELGQPLLIDYVWGRQVGEYTINP